MAGLDLGGVRSPRAGTRMREPERNVRPGGRPLAIRFSLGPRPVRSASVIPANRAARSTMSLSASSLGT
jgi:hypothetical protein